ncbi:MAG TPA: PIG-L family deacetylase [Acidimicrobiales bacterium]
MDEIDTRHPAGRHTLARVRDGAPVRLLGVWAHPDDEAYLSAGLMARVAGAGGRVTCLTATRGEQGVPDDDPRAPEVVGLQRELELRAALAAAGTHRLRLLGHPDGGCDAVPHEQGVAAVARAIAEDRPDVIVTFGPDGVTGHPDHVAVHRWTTEAWRRSGRGVLLYATLTDAFLARHRALHERVGVFGDHRPVGCAAADVALAVDLDAGELDRKRRVLAAHASQTTGLAAAMGEDAYRRWFDQEAFRLPSPAEVSAASRVSQPSMASISAR